MTRWSTILPAASASELLELAEILRKAATLALARVQATEGFQSASTLTGPDAKVAICMVGAVAVCAVSYLVSKRCAKTPNVKEVLAMNPDLFAFSSFYDRILSKALLSRISAFRHALHGAPQLPRGQIQRWFE
mmetsp:Transcript_34925/g.81844  ORF Transcript_34925/g.81844 Transcript_34925/m.81844 type:complete len:133 (+) Transcript_34925:75-473(+)